MGFSFTNIQLRPFPAFDASLMDGVERFKAELPECRARQVSKELPPLKHQRLVHERGIRVVFDLIPQNPEYMGYAPVTVYLIPRKCWEGQCAITLDNCYPARISPPFVFPLYRPALPSSAPSQGRENVL